MTLKGSKPRIFPPASEEPKPGQRLFVCDGCGTEYWMRTAATKAWCFVCWTWTSYSAASNERRAEVRG